MINIKELSKYYGSNLVLDNIDLEFDEGSVNGIVGENGAGKTTLFKCIAGLESFIGQVHSGINPLKNRLGYLETESYFFSKITGREYIQMLCQARGELNQDIDGKNIFDLPLNQYAETYSTGMKKKLALTAILLQQNEVYILDEPFNGVDIQSNIIITEIIKRLKSLRKTVIISSHIFSTLSDTCDKIHLLKVGKIIKSVDQAQFEELNEEMKQSSIGIRIDKLELK